MLKFIVLTQIVLSQLFILRSSIASNYLCRRATEKNRLTMCAVTTNERPFFALKFN